ncbi:MAG: hypothetical protein VYC64_10445, partial [Candidatus Latescibacterota bacterium]|nr:hypothetical protein [Candidatus Latescibacterota bacterium]
DVITCGHTHSPIDMTVEGHRYLNTGCWTETPAFVVIVHEEGVDYRPFPSTNGEVTGGREAPC